MQKIGEGLTVLDLTQGMAGGLATMVLADAGAEVVKIEPPDGDWSRIEPAWIMWNRGKKSVVLDLTTEEGQKRLGKLASVADVMLVNSREKTLTKLGLGYDKLHNLNPALVYCHISGFGPLSKYEHLKGYDAIVNAKTGRNYAFARQLKGKTSPPYAALMCGTYGAAMLALQGIMTALFIRENGGGGQKVTTSVAQALHAYDWQWLGYQMSLRPDAKPPAPGGSPTPQYYTTRCGDGRWIQLSNNMTHLFINFITAIGLSDILTDPRFEGLPNVSPEHRDTLFRMIDEKMAGKSLDEWMGIFVQKFDVAGEPFLSTQEAMNHPQVVHNGNFIDLEDPSVGKTKQLGPLFTASATPLTPEGGAPALGQHTDEVIAGLAKKKPPAYKNGKLPKHPLDGVTVVEFATFYAAPYGTAILADLGARVIKIESLDGDTFRRYGYVGTKPLQGKESVALDLKKPEAQKICHEILKTADILMHNFRPGVPQRLGFDYETVKTINPGIVYVYGGSYGATGPYAHRAAFHPIPGAAAGGAMYQAGREMPPPLDKKMSWEELREVSSTLFQANEGNPDSSSALGLAVAMLMGLYTKRKFGIGQYIETTMVGSCLYTNADDAISYEGKPERLLPDGQLMGLHGLWRFYNTKKGWVFLAIATEREWQSFANAIGRKGLLTDQRFATRDLRLKNEQALIKELEPVFAAKIAADWESSLAKVDVACAEAFEGAFGEWSHKEPTLRDVGLWVEVNHPSIGPYRRFGPEIVFPKIPAKIGATQYVGEHTQKVLKQLGYSPDRMDELKALEIATWTTRDDVPDD